MRWALLLILALAGCSVVLPLDKASEAAAKAEERIGRSTARALDGIAVLASRLVPAAENISAISSEVRSIAETTRENVEGGWLSKRLLIGLIAVVMLTLGHSVFAHRRLGKRLHNLTAKPLA